MAVDNGGYTFVIRDETSRNINFVGNILTLFREAEGRRGGANISRSFHRQDNLVIIASGRLKMIRQYLSLLI